MKRLRFIHLVWLALVLAAGWIEVMRGVDTAQLLGVMFVAGLPGLMAVIHFGIDSESAAGRRLGDRLLISVWTLMAALGLALTGGAGSPLTVLFAVGPMVAFGLGRRALAAEASVFAVMAYFATAVMGAMGYDFGGQVLDNIWGPGFAFAGLILAALLVWTLFKSAESAMRTARIEAAALGRAEMAGRKPETPETAPAPRGGMSRDVLAGLPELAGVLLLDITPEGRIRSYSGDVLGMTLIKPGQALATIFSGGEDISALMTHEGWTGEVELAHGRRVAISTARTRTGSQILLRDVDGQLETGEALKQAQEALKDRTAFFASLGHDLKTPLNAILGYSDMMRSGIRGPMPEPYADYPSIIHESGQDLLLLVDDILDLAKADADSHRLELEPVDLSASGQSVMRQLENQAERAGVTMTLRGEPEVWAQADARAVRQIWQNLVSNAIKYSDRGGEVILDARQGDKAMTLKVIDTGAGMTEDDLARATEPFQQGRNASGRVGTGLGLAVVKRFAELHDGTLHITTAPGQGTEVEVSLPKADMSDVRPLEEAAQ